MLRSHKILIRTVAKDRSYFTRAAGTERSAYNWCLNIAEVYHALNGETLSDFDLLRLWNSHRKIMLPWTYEVTKHAGESGIKHFCAARANWFSALGGRKALEQRRRFRNAARHLTWMNCEATPHGRIAPSLSVRRVAVPAWSVDD